jgi:hypothetical protein
MGSLVSGGGGEEREDMGCAESLSKLSGEELIARVLSNRVLWKFEPPPVP